MEEIPPLPVFDGERTGAERSEGERVRGLQLPVCPSPDHLRLSDLLVVLSP